MKTYEKIRRWTLVPLNQSASPPIPAIQSLSQSLMQSPTFETKQLNWFLGLLPGVLPVSLSHCFQYNLSWERIWFKHSDDLQVSAMSLSSVIANFLAWYTNLCMLWHLAASVCSFIPVTHVPSTLFTLKCLPLSSGPTWLSFSLIKTSSQVHSQPWTSSFWKEVLLTS